MTKKTITVSGLLLSFLLLGTNVFAGDPLKPLMRMSALSQETLQQIERNLAKRMAGTFPTTEKVISYTDVIRRTPGNGLDRDVRVKLDTRLSVAPSLYSTKIFQREFQQGQKSIEEIPSLSQSMDSQKKLETIQVRAENELIDRWLKISENQVFFTDINELAAKLNEFYEGEGEHLLTPLELEGKGEEVIVFKLPLKGIIYKGPWVEGGPALNPEVYAVVYYPSTNTASLAIRETVKTFEASSLQRQTGFTDLHFYTPFETGVVNDNLPIAYQKFKNKSTALRQRKAYEEIGDFTHTTPRKKNF